MAKLVQREWNLQRAIVTYLSKALPPTAYFTLIDIGSAGSAQQGALRKARGVKPGIADVLIAYLGATLWLEIKAGTQLSEHQKLFRDQVMANGHCWALARCPEDVEQACRDVGIPLARRSDRSTRASPSKTNGCREAQAHRVPQAQERLRHRGAGASAWGLAAVSAALELFGRVSRSGSPRRNGRRGNREGGTCDAPHEAPATDNGDDQSCDQDRDHSPQVGQGPVQTIGLAQALGNPPPDTLYRLDPAVTGSRDAAASSLSMAAVIRRSMATDLDGVSGCFDRHLSSIVKSLSEISRRNEVPL